MDKTKTRLYHIWNGMRGRCLHESCAGYKYYGAKGVSICEDWGDFDNFKKWALNNGYKDGLTLDRIDNKKGYSPNNCRWVTIKMQENNRSNNRRLFYKGEYKTVSEWAEYLGFNTQTLFTRLQRGWSIERALTTPIKVKGGGHH